MAAENKTVVQSRSSQITVFSVLVFHPCVKMDVILALLAAFPSMDNNTKDVHVELAGVVRLTNGGFWEYQILHHVEADCQCCIVTLPKQIIKHPCSSAMQNERC